MTTEWRIPVAMTTDTLKPRLTDHLTTGEPSYQANHAQSDSVLTHSFAHYTVVSVCSYIYLLVTSAIETCGTCSRDCMGGRVFVHSALPTQGPKIADALRIERDLRSASHSRTGLRADHTYLLIRASFQSRIFLRKDKLNTYYQLYHLFKYLPVSSHLVVGHLIQ